jgi:hypothetical protein
MSVERIDYGFDWARITFIRARVFAGLENQMTEQKIADWLNVELSTVRSHVEDLKAITGCRDVRELGRWWRANRESWCAWCAEQAGMPKSDRG